jgi:hypothetical protein
MAANTLPSDTADALAPAVSRLRTLRGAVSGSVRPTAFWVATLLPFTYVPLLASGFATDHVAAFLALLAANAVAFVLGHAHNQQTPGRDV